MAKIKLSELIAFIEKKENDPSYLDWYVDGNLSLNLNQAQELLSMYLQTFITNHTYPVLNLKTRAERMALKEKNKKAENKDELPSNTSLPLSTQQFDYPSEDKKNSIQNQQITIEIDKDTQFLLYAAENKKTVKPEENPQEALPETDVSKTYSYGIKICPKKENNGGQNAGTYSQQNLIHFSCSMNKEHPLHPKPEVVKLANNNGKIVLPRTGTFVKQVDIEQENIVNPKALSLEEIKDEHKNAKKIADNVDKPKYRFYYNDITKYTAFISMKNMAGPNLSEWQKRKPLLLDKLSIAKSCCEKLAKIHKKDTTHNDIKPENIQVITNSDKKEEAQFVDFGLTTKINTRHPTVGGTPKYISSRLTDELLKNLCCKAPEYDYKKEDDLFALGITLAQVFGIPIPYKPIQALGHYFVDVVQLHKSVQDFVDAPESTLTEADAAILIWDLIYHQEGEEDMTAEIASTRFKEIIDREIKRNKIELLDESKVEKEKNYFNEQYNSLKKNKKNQEKISTKKEIFEILKTHYYTDESRTTPKPPEERLAILEGFMQSKLGRSMKRHQALQPTRREIPLFSWVYNQTISLVKLILEPKYADSYNSLLKQQKDLTIKCLDEHLATAKSVTPQAVKDFKKTETYGMLTKNRDKLGVFFKSNSQKKADQLLRYTVENKESPVAA